MSTADKKKKKKQKDKKGVPVSADDHPNGLTTAAEGDGGNLLPLWRTEENMLGMPLLAVCPAIAEKFDKKVVAVNGSHRVVLYVYEEKKAPAGRAYSPGSVFESLHLDHKAPVELRPLEKSVPCKRLTLHAPKDLFETRSSKDTVKSYLMSCLTDGLYFEGNCVCVSLYGRKHMLKVLGCEPKMEEEPVQVTRQTNLEIVLDDEPVKQAGLGLKRIGGLKPVVEELRSFVQMPLENPEAYSALGIKPPKGVLLYGPPGTGKTLLAKSLAEEMDCHVELCNSTDLISKYAGESEERIRNVFELCADKARSTGKGVLLFLDEIDAICPIRDDATESERRVVATFLTLLDGATDKTARVIVLGATNRPNAIDPALRRAGRLEREVEVGVPNAPDRREILKVCLDGMKADLSEADLDDLASKTHGFVGADLKALCHTAATSAIGEGRAEMQVGHFVNALRSIRPSAMKELYVEVPKVRWSDIGGYSAVKSRLQEMVEWPIKHADAFKAMNITPPRGVLLYGPPGCSKTMMAKAVATESEMNFISVKGPELFSKWVGESEKAVRELFRKARLCSPCVIFFDEVDAIGTSRDQESGVGSRVLSQMLNEMDGIAQSQQVVVIAATNCPDVLDSALMRPGRFDRLLHVPLPDVEAREAMLRWHLKRTPSELDEADIAEFVDKTERYSGAETVMVVRESALAALREGASAVTKEHVAAALKIVTPRIPQSMLDFYNSFEQQHSN